MSVIETTPKKIRFGEEEKTIYRVQPLYNRDGQTNPLLASKLIPREELPFMGDWLRKRGVCVSLTTGVFDMKHIGHERYLELARAIAGEMGALVVGLNSDSSVRALKGPDRPIMTELQRAEALSFLSVVSFITIFPESTGAEIIRQVKPDRYLCVEGSWQGGDIAAKEEVQAMFEQGGDIFYAPRQDPTVSTTALIDRIVKTDVATQLKAIMQK